MMLQIVRSQRPTSWISRGNTHPETRDQIQHHLHVPDPRDVFQRYRPFGQQSRRQHGERGILVASRLERPPDRVPSANHIGVGVVSARILILVGHSRRLPALEHTTGGIALQVHSRSRRIRES